MTNIFERAAKSKLRFESGKGNLATEDLFDLSLTSLDSLAKKVNKQIQDEGEVSFLSTTSTTKSSTDNRLRLDLLKHVIATKEAELEARKNRAETQAKIAKLQELAAAKQDEALSAQSLEDIQKQLAELQASV